jgi:hypothetical protein
VCNNLRGVDRTDSMIYNREFWIIRVLLVLQGRDFPICFGTVLCRHNGGKVDSSV